MWTKAGWYTSLTCTSGRRELTTSCSCARTCRALSERNLRWAKVVFLEIYFYRYHITDTGRSSYAGYSRHRILQLLKNNTLAQAVVYRWHAFVLQDAVSHCPARYL